MTLVISLKPAEKVIIGGALITNNSEGRTCLQIEGDVAKLREKDIMLEKDADSPCKKIYLVVQLMYLSREPHKMYGLFFDLVREIQTAAPSTTLFFARIGEHILSDAYYKALKEARLLIDHEENLLAAAA